MVDIMDFDYDPNAPEEIQYYIVGVHPLRVTVVDELPIKIEKPDENGVFVKDNAMIRRLNDSLDVEEVDEARFREYCLSQGVRV